MPKPRIAVPKGDIVDLQLTEKVEKGELRNVEIIPFVGSPYEVFGRVKNGEADICAQPAANFERYLQELPGARVLDGKFGDNFVALAIPKGLPERRQYLSEWIEAGKKNGLIQGMIGHSNLIGAYVSRPEPIK